MRCQTSVKGASITADSRTEVEVGMRDMVRLVGVECSGLMQWTGFLWIMS